MSDAVTIYAGGATAEALRILAQGPNRFWAHHEILVRLPHPKSLNWSLRYARQMGWIEVAGDPRNQRYWRYRITQLGLEAFEN